MNGLLAFLRASALLVAERIVRLPMHPKIRARLLGLLGANIGRGVRIDEIMITNLDAGFGHLRVGESGYIAAGVILDMTAPISLGARAGIGAGAVILTHADPGSMYGNALSPLYPRKEQAVVIGEDAWVGAHSTLLCGVTIGARAIVGSGAVVLTDIPDDVVAVGVPARVKAHERARAG